MFEGEDQMGRWSYITICGKQNTRLIIITAYRANYNINNHGSVYMQEYRELIKKGYKDPKPRKMMLHDLSAFIRSKQQHPSLHYDFIICIDANESLSDNQEFKIFTEENLLLDGLHHLHPTLPEVPTYQKGSKQIDYILISEGIIETAQRGGILPLNSIVISDHRMLYIDVNITSILKGMQSHKTHISTRKLRTDNVQSCDKYTEYVVNKCKEHDILCKLRRASIGLDAAETISGRHKWVRKIQRYSIMMDDFMMTGEKQCKNTATKTHAWSPTLVRAGRCVSYWKHRLHSYKYQVPITDFYHSLRKELQINDNLHGTEECSADGRCVCKPSYMDDNCQYCIPSSLIVSGNNGSILNQTGYGVKCSK